MIPKILMQTVRSAGDVAPEILDNFFDLAALNPEWEHRIYEDGHIRQFILAEYGLDMLDTFDTISPEYGAARADFFRYLAMYRLGGVYLDAKSTCKTAFDFKQNDAYVLSQWPYGSGWGQHFGMPPLGEYQQWHIICEPAHPFLAAVIARVLLALRSDNGVGREAVWQITGPIAYTLAIEPIRHRYPHLLVDIRRLGFRYSIYEDRAHHKALGSQHYFTAKMPLTNNVLLSNSQN